MSVASYHGSRFPELAFLGESPETLRTYTTFLVDPGSEVHLLVAAEQRAIAERAFAVIEIRPSWRAGLSWRGAAADPGAATALKPRHLAAMQAWRRRPKSPPWARKLFKRGPTMGIWEGRTLIAMGATRTRLPEVAEIGKIAWQLPVSAARLSRRMSSPRCCRRSRKRSS